MTGSGASGINAVVVTSRWLLGFSSRTLTWYETDRDLNEKVLERRMLPTFSVVTTDKHLYGFRGADGVCLDEALGIREMVKRTQTTDYGAVFVTNERLVGFASLLGDFSSKALGITTHHALDNENGLNHRHHTTAHLVSAAALADGRFECASLSQRIHYHCESTVSDTFI